MKETKETKITFGAAIIIAVAFIVLIVGVLFITLNVNKGRN